MHILQPTAYEELIRSLIDTWRFEGYLPDARSSNYNGRTQGGSNADTILADAYVKGVRGAIDWSAGYQAMVKDAEVAPPNTPVDPMAPDSSTKEGRGALPDWLSLGFITPRFTRAVSRAVEYAGNDFGLYQVAQGLGRHDDAQKYLQRSRNWRNHWNENQTSLGFAGFVVPRDENGFVEIDPVTSSGYWGDPFYEASSWAYSWAGVHDMAALVEMMGGVQTARKRLDTMFTVGAGGGSGTLFDPTNEPYVDQAGRGCECGELTESGCLISPISTTTSASRISLSHRRGASRNRVTTLAELDFLETVMPGRCRPGFCGT